MTEISTLMSALDLSVHDAAREFSVCVETIYRYRRGDRKTPGIILRVLRAQVRDKNGDAEGAFNAIRYPGKGVCYPCLHQEGIEHKGSFKGYHRHAKKGVVVSMCRPAWEGQEVFYG